MFYELTRSGAFTVSSISFTLKYILTSELIFITHHCLACKISFGLYLLPVVLWLTIILRYNNGSSGHTEPHIALQNFNNIL